MSFLAAVDDPQGFACLVTDTRMPQGEDSFSDELKKQTVLKHGAVGWCGATLRWVRLRGASLNELSETIPRLHGSGIRWAASREGRRSDGERAWQQALDGPRPEIPEGADPRTFTKFAAVSMARPGVHVYATHGPETPDPVPNIIFWPPGHEGAEDEILPRARERAGSPTDLPWGVAIRALAALNDGAAAVWERVGPVVDVAVVDREAGELRRGRAKAKELVDASDEELLNLVRPPTLGERVQNRLRAAAWAARTRIETV